VNAFTPIPRDASRDQLYRAALLAQPPGYFESYVGTVPDPMQRVRLVEEFIRRMDAARLYANETYRVEVRHAPPFIHLDIIRRDGAHCTNWRDFQQIKNEIIGPEYEGVELFPAESRLVDTSNEYHLWIAADPSFRFPFGYARRIIAEAGAWGGRPAASR
jgi:hypothetical protein